MVEIIVAAAECRQAQGAIVTGYAVSPDRPGLHGIFACDPTHLLRIYEGYGVMRAETGVAPRKGFGTLIGQAQVSVVQQNQGMKIWLRVKD